MIALIAKVAAGLFVAYGVACGLMWGFQRDLLFHPSRGLDAPTVYGLSSFKVVDLADRDGTKITVWQSEPRDQNPTVVFFHGNGGNLGSRAEILRALSDAGFGVLAVSYRGYGTSEGTPSEAGIYEDARSVIRYATGPLGLPVGRLILYGESLGTGVAVQIATEAPVGAVVLQAPYTSVERLASDRYPWLPVSLLLSDRFDSISKIGRIHSPVLMFYGERDSVVPARYGNALYETAPDPKEAVSFPRVGHNGFDPAVLTQRLKLFWTKHRVPRQAKVEEGAEERSG
jgi:fermentation-respiration switch protein FrsA (DUF1100 family)